MSSLSAALAAIDKATPGPLYNNIQEKIKRALDMFESSFIYKGEELILHKKWNVYFLLPDVKSEHEFDYKLLSYLSFYTASNHFKKATAQYKWASGKIKQWFGKEFSHEDFQVIYQEIGCGANEPIGVAFIKAGLDMSLLQVNRDDALLAEAKGEWK